MNGEANTCTLVGVFEQLGTAVETLDIPLDGDALAAVIALRDRLEARISDAIAAYDAVSLWELDGATSLTGWLADRGGMARPRAAASAARARTPPGAAPVPHPGRPLAHRRHPQP